MSSSKLQRVDNICIKAVNTIREKLQKEKGIKISFTSGSLILGTKYFRNQLGVIPYDEIEDLFGNRRKRHKMIQNTVI